MLQNIKAKKENLILEGIISAVDMHRQAMQLVYSILIYMCMCVCGIRKKGQNP